MRFRLLLLGTAAGVSGISLLTATAATGGSPPPSIQAKAVQPALPDAVDQPDLWWGKHYRYIPPPPPPTTTTTTAPRHFPIEPSRSAPIKQAVVVAEPSGYSTACYPAIGMAPRNSTEVCISAHENGGCYDRSRNATHFGRWQFDRGTWAGNTGNPADWGYASPAEQDRVFMYAVAHGGYGRWTNYDGC